MVPISVKAINIHMATADSIINGVLANSRRAISLALYRAPDSASYLSLTVQKVASNETSVIAPNIIPAICQPACGVGNAATSGLVSADVIMIPMKVNTW